MTHCGIFSANRIERGLRALIFVGCALAGSTEALSEDWADLTLRSHDVLGSLSCTSVTCHGRVEPRNLPGALSQQEYLHWLGGQPTYVSGLRHYDPRARAEKDFADPHALAGRRILEPRFQEVLQRASNLPDSQVDPQIYAKCATCHDPLRVAEATGEPERILAAERGIGCESCHGGARNWIATHYQRDVSRQQLSACGMIDTKNVLVRARLCASCHVGSADQDMNHDMIAAGHPPLRFETASHQALLERKHWNDAPRRLSEPNYEVQLWAAGRIASADAALALLEGRAQRADSRQRSWPEFAESTCFACHQPLRPSARNPQQPAIRRGTPTWQTWNVALTSLLVAPPLVGENELPPPTLAFAASLQQIREQMDRTIRPKPEDVAQAAAAARTALRDQVRISPRGEICGRDGMPVGVEFVADMLVNSQELGEPNWERCCHELAAVLAAERSVRDAAAQESALRVIASEQMERRVAACDKIRQRAKQLAESLRFVSKDFEWPAVMTRAEPPGPGFAAAITLGECAAEIKLLAGELRRINSSAQY